MECCYAPFFFFEKKQAKENDFLNCGDPDWRQSGCRCVVGQVEAPLFETPWFPPWFIHVYMGRVLHGLLCARHCSGPNVAFPMHLPPSRFSLRISRGACARTIEHDALRSQLRAHSRERHFTVGLVLLWVSVATVEWRSSCTKCLHTSV